MDCPDCGVRPGKWHRPGCAWELCPYCGTHVVDCVCTEGLPPLDDRMPWIGTCPWLDACLEFGFFGREVGGRWVSCGAHEQDSQPDVRRLVRECSWDRTEKRFVRRLEERA